MNRRGGLTLCYAGNGFASKVEHNVSYCGLRGGGMETELNKTQGHRVQVLCRKCKRLTNHVVLVAAESRGFVPWGPDDGLSWSNNHEIIQCQGCDDISFRYQSSNSEDCDEHGETNVEEVIFPRRTLETVGEKVHLSVPSNLRRIYRETVDCYNNDDLSLCGAGVRALVEGICTENGITDGPVEETRADGSTARSRASNLKGKINGLFERGVLTRPNADVLHEHRYLGNEAMHDLARPSKKELSIAISIVEHVFESIYEIPAKGSLLRRARRPGAGHGDLP